MATKLISNAIAYVNGSPHLGHTVGLLQADVLARTARAAGHEVFFTTGTDENSLKNVRAAEAAGVSTPSWVDGHARQFAALNDRLAISADTFVRTTDLSHRAGVESLWRACAGDLYRRRYQGLYCVGCERFFSESELVDGLCPEHGVPPEAVEEENWFFALSRYQAALLDLIDSGRLLIVPGKHRRAVRDFVAEGLEDISVSRSSGRARGWGIPVPGDPAQVIYVWFDALANYLTADPDFWRRADERIHVVGKGITRFHAVYWPAILLAAGEPLPTRLFVHDYITVEGKKIGKSLGNAVDPIELTSTYGSEALRYYVLRHLRATSDGDFDRDRLDDVRRTELADRIGNLLSRTTALAARHGIDPKPPACRSPLADTVGRAIEAFDAALALEAVIAAVDETNAYIERTAPWRLAKSGDRAGLEAVLQTALARIAEVGAALRPFVPETAARIEAALVPPIRAAEPLFPKDDRPRLRRRRA